MRNWTYKISDPDGLILSESGDINIEREQDARQHAINSMLSILNAGTAQPPLSLVLTVHGPVYRPMSMTEERYTENEIREYGKGEDLSLGELLSIAKDHYCDGGDVVYECWDQRFYDDYTAMFGPVKRADTDGLFASMRG